MTGGNIMELEKKIIEMEKQLDEGETGKEKVDVLNELADAYVSSKPDATYKYARKALALAENIDYRSGIATSFIHMALYYRVVSEYDESLDYSSKALQIFEEIKDKRGIAKTYSCIGMVYNYLSDYKVALEYLLKAVGLYEEVGDRLGIAKSYHNIGMIYFDQKSYDFALKYDFLARDIYEKIGYKEGVGMILNNIGSIYLLMEDLGSALDYYKKSLPIHEEMGNIVVTARALSNIGSTYINMGKHEKSIDYFLRSLKMKEESGDRLGMTATFINIGKAYMNLSDYNKSLDYMQKGLDIALDIGAISIQIPAYLELHNLYKETGDYKLSLEYFTMYQELNQEVFHEKNAEKIANLQIKYEAERKEKEAEIFRLKNVELEEMVAERTAELGSEIIERTRAEESLRESEERYRSLQANIPVGVFRTTPAGEYLSANVALADMLGYETVDELIGIPVANAYASPEGRQGFIDSIDEEGMVVDFETQLKRKDDTVIWVSFNSRAVADENGAIIHYDGIVEDITERKRAEKQIKSSLAEKEVLLREVHHRVENNMQIISSLLNLQAGYVEDENLLMVFKESQNRIRAMSLIHDSLYKSEDFAQINFAEYIQILAQRAFNAYSPDSRDISLEVNVDDVYLDINTSIPVALIINELVSNVVKHAFPGGKNGRLTIGFEEYEEGKYLLKVADDGVGLPDGFDPENQDSLGMGLITALVMQINGELKIDGEDGAVFSIKFELKEDE